MRLLIVVAIVAASFAGCASQKTDSARRHSPDRSPMQLHYLEIVAKDVDAVCAAYEASNGLRFGPPEPMLGNARTAIRPGGGKVGVRAPMRETEEPVIRPYWLVEDIKSAVAGAAAAGAEIAHPPLEIPGQGTFAIYIVGGTHHGLWQL